MVAVVPGSNWVAAAAAAAAAGDRDCDEEHDCRNGGIQQTPAFEAAACRDTVLRASYSSGMNSLGVAIV